VLILPVIGRMTLDMNRFIPYFYFDKLSFELPEYFT